VNTDEVRAAVSYLRPDVRSALLVQDENPADLYATTLGQAFRARFPDSKHTLIDPPEVFDSSVPVDNAFALMMPDICQQHPDVVFFGGRGPELEAFIEALADRQCQSLQINIMTGDDGVEVQSGLRRQRLQDSHALENGLRANVTLKYTALAHPDSWESAPQAFSPATTFYFQRSCADCFRTIFPGDSLDDGQAIMGHDAVIVAVTAIRYTTEPTRPASVIQALNRLHGQRAVNGASGLVSLDEHGNPANKPIPVLQLRPDGVITFVTLTSPIGSPPAAAGT
jgi:ABC-type branched-subunit amino acid transport system substrate-binding protein